MHMTTVDYTDVEAYLDYLREHGRREATIETASNVLRHVMDLLAADGRPTNMDAITLDDVRWLATTLRVKDSSRKIYIQMISRMSVVRGGPDYAKLLDLIWNRPETDRCFITIADFVTLYTAAEPWDRLALVLGAFMGLRRSEICRMREVDIEGNTVLVHGKGHGPEGLVVRMTIPPDVMREIESFREYKKTHFNPNRDGDDHILQTPHWGMWVPVCPEVVSHRMSELGKRCGIRFTTHALRRLFATTLVNDVGADLDTVRRLMRHADISTTIRCYVAADPSKMNSAMDGLMNRYAAAFDSI